MRIHNPVVVAVFLVAGVMPIVAHHSFAAEYDATQPVKVTGVVTRVDHQQIHRPHEAAGPDGGPEREDRAADHLPSRFRDEDAGLGQVHELA